jgi:xanthine dehydrogenase accessory factor
MKEVIEEAVRLMEKKEPCVLATVVRTKGMTPQKAGAKLLIRRDGSSLGTLGGGCVEGDIWFYAKQMLREKNGPQFRDYYLNEDIAAKDGLVCGGTMYFYLEPLWPGSDFLNFAKEVVEAYTSGLSVAIATIVKEGTGEKIGSKILIREDGSVSGSLAKDALQQQVVKTGRGVVAAYGKNAYVVDEDGTEVYVEGFTTPPTLVIMGGGHVGKAVYQLAVTLGFRIYIVDDRPEFSNRERFPQAQETVVAEFDKGVKMLPINFNTFFLVATRGHRFDDMATLAAVQTPARYIGLLGSKRKNLMIFRDLIKEGVSLDRLKQINAPVGLNIGALTPEELAVSIMAEIVLHLRGGDGRPMKMDSKNLLEQIEKLTKPTKPPLPF